MPIQRSPIPSGRRGYHRVRVQNPTTPPAVVDGAPVLTPWVDATPPDWFVAMEPTVLSDQERIKAAGVLAQPSVTVIGPYRADVSTASQLIDDRGHVLHVLAVDDPGRRGL